MESVEKKPKTEHLDRFIIADWFRGLQDSICAKLEEVDSKGIFTEELWHRDGGGGGRTRMMANANTIEKGGVNFSEVHGILNENVARSLEVGNGHDFFASGVSIVMHPFNPFVPIIHMNVRYFELSSGEKWFGGGIDLTPAYIQVKEASEFHHHLKEICDKYHPSYYVSFKEWADNYFYLSHRDETRGVGGIFFDRLSVTKEFQLTDRFHFIQDIGNAFIPIYTHLITKNRDRHFGKREKEFQLFRRGRYVEFNLLYDKGTKFGIDSGGRTESILMSLPPEANWKSHYKIPVGGKEDETMKLLKRGIDWIGMR